MTFCVLLRFIIESFICRYVGFQLKMLHVFLKVSLVPLGTLSLGAIRFMSIKKTSPDVLCSTQIFALLMLAGHDLFFILEALLKPDSSCKFPFILYCFQFGKILFPGQCILGP